MLRYFILICIQSLVLLTYGQHAGGECGTKINNNERKIFKKLPPVRETAISMPGSVKGITIQYLGAGGILITHNNTTIAIDPFFSNIPVKPWTHSIRPDTIAIENVSGINNLRNADAVFITHAHYDHLLDVPYLYKKVFTKRPSIHGSKSVNNLLKNLVPAADLINVQDSASRYTDTKIHWIYVNQTIRVMPILSDHAPHYKYLKLFDGEAIIAPTEEEYYKGTEPALWKEGRTLAYFVEIIEKSDTFRIHIQTSACTPTEGLPPQAYIQQVGNADVAMICMASFDNVDDYPDRLLNYLKPEKVVIVHWENFFSKYSLNKKRHKVVSVTNGLCFLERLEKLLYPGLLKEKCLLPLPNSVIHIN
ncbi:MAG: MBL fold metallo-hydrolase [Bacteroidia bacterium]